MSGPKSASRGLFISLQWRLILAYTLIFTLCFGTAAAWIFNPLYRQTMRVVIDDLVATLHGTASGLEPDVLQALATRTPPLRADGYPEDDSFWRQAQWLATAEMMRSHVRYHVYLASETQVEFLVSGGALAAPPTGYKFREIWQAAPAELAAYQQGLITTTVQTGPGPGGACVYHGQGCAVPRQADWWRTRLSVFAPVTDAKGQVVAGLRADYDTADIEAARQGVARQIVLIGLGSYLVTVALIYLAATLAARPAMRLARAVQGLRRGRALDLPEAGGAFRDEIDLLAGELARRQELEAALSASEARYRMIAGNSVDVIWAMTPEGRFTYVSPSVEAQRGFTPEEVQQQPVTQALPSPETAGALVRHLAQRIAALEAGDEGARVETNEVEQACKDGTTVMTEVVSKLITGPDGRVIEIVGITRDISLRTQLQHARQLAEAALRESEERFRRIFELAPLGAAVVELDFRFSRVNQAFCHMLGYAPDELLKLTFPEVTHPDDRPASRALAERLLRGQTGQMSMVKRYLRKDGSAVWGQVWVRLIRNSAGAPLYFLTLIWDLTGQRETEAARRAAEECYQDIYDNAVEGIFQSLPSGRFRSLNPAMARIFGYASPEEMMAIVGDGIAHRVYADPAARADFRRWLELEGEVREFETRHLRKDGSVIWTRTNARAVRDETGAVLYYEGFLEEITARKAAEEEIRRLNADLEQRVEARTAELRQANAALSQALRVKSEFLSMMSHELRTPLAGVLGLSQLLRTQVYGPVNQKQAGALAELEDSGQQLLELIGDVLDFAGAGEGSLALEVRDVLVGPLVQGVVRAVAPSATRKQQRVTVERDAALTTAPADEHRLRQMLVHLLNNAVKFTPAGGALGVEVALADYATRREVRFTVWDTGIGVAPADQERIFEPFVQLDSRLARAYGGSGLGLALVRRLAELHGGRVTVESEGVPGRGSRFSIYLPWREAEPPDVPAGGSGGQARHFSA